MPKRSSKPICFQCKGPRSGSFAAIIGGALLINSRTRSSTSVGSGKRLDAFWHLVWHGAHDGTDPEIYEHLEIVDDLRGGEFELQFCTTKCLRRFLNAKVDELEAKRDREERRKKRTKASTKR